MKELLYHGSDKVVKKPLFGVGKKDNDYGAGFYTTKDIDKARESIQSNFAYSKENFCYFPVIKNEVSSPSKNKEDADKGDSYDFEL